MLKKWSKKKILLCPVCGKPYEYCHGEVKTPYFRHMDKAECEDKYSESETEEHLNGKMDLYEWIKKQNGVENAVLEGWIPETKQRPDIMFNYNNKKYVIEYQCSPIATEYIERHELYQAAGINDIWICGTDKYLQHNMREKFLQKESLGFYDPKFKMFISIPYKNYYWEMKNINQKYSHTNDYFYGLPLNTFVFDSEIFNVLFGKVEVADKKRKIRNNNKNCNENNYPNKYLELQKEKLWERLYNNLQHLSNDNWVFYINIIRTKYATYKSICAEPRIIYDMNYTERKYLGVKYFEKIGLTYMEYGVFKECANNINYLKELLLPIMIKNKEKILNYRNFDKRFMEVRHE